MTTTADVQAATSPHEIIFDGAKNLQEIEKKFWEAIFFIPQSIKALKNFRALVPYS